MLQPTSNICQSLIAKKQANEEKIKAQEVYTYSTGVCMYHQCVYVRVCVCVHVCVYVRACMYICMYACMYVRMYVCMYVRVCMYVCMHMYVCTYRVAIHDITSVM